MAESKKTQNTESKLSSPDSMSICDSTKQMLNKAREDNVETAFERADTMKACPIGADSACCKHCSMGPCRLNPKDPYGKVGVCGATIDTIQARNFGRMVSAGAAAHTDHGMSMLDLFRKVVKGEIPDYEIKDTAKLLEVAASVGIQIEERSIQDVALELYEELVLCGVIYYAEGQPAGFIVGDELNEETFALHFAKGKREFRGIYEYMFSTFAELLPRRYRLLNFEQDLGIEALRKAKSAYNPDYLMEKYRLSLK